MMIALSSSKWLFIIVLLVGKITATEENVLASPAPATAAFGASGSGEHPPEEEHKNTGDFVLITAAPISIYAEGSHSGSAEGKASHNIHRVETVSQHGESTVEETSQHRPSVTTNEKTHVYKTTVITIEEKSENWHKESTAEETSRHVSNGGSDSGLSILVEPTKSTEPSAYLILVSDFQNGVIQHAYMKNEDDINVSFSPLSLRITHGIEGIAYDPVNGMVYWSNRDAKVIERAYLDGSQRQVILKNVDASSIAIDISKRRLFFDVNDKVGIQYSNLDGTGRTTLVKGPIEEINDVEINTRFLYFSSIKSQTVERALKSNGDRRTTLAKDVSATGLGISATGNGIYWTDKSYKHVMASSLTGENTTTVGDTKAYTDLRDIAAIGKYLFVISGDSQRLIRINRNNKEVKQIGNAVFNDPRKIKVRFRNEKLRQCVSARPRLLRIMMRELRG